MELQEIIVKWKLNKQLLASKLGLQKGTFQNKLDPNHNTKFTADELILLRCALIEIRNDLNSIDEISFDEAMKIIAKQKV